LSLESAGDEKPEISYCDVKLSYQHYLQGNYTTHPSHNSRHQNKMTK